MVMFNSNKGEGEGERGEAMINNVDRGPRASLTKCLSGNCIPSKCGGSSPQPRGEACSACQCARDYSGKFIRLSGNPPPLVG